nr:zinc finger CCCH domain-containing protein 18-like [Dermacentor andersoni]
MATAAPPMLPDVPPSVTAVPAASLEPAAAGPPEPKQPTKVVDHAPAEAASTGAAVPDARESKSKGAEPVPDASRQDPDAVCALSPPTLADQSTTSQSQKMSHNSHRHHSRRHVALDESAFDSNSTSPPSRTAKADYRAYVSKVPRKHRSHHKSFQYEDQSNEKDGKDTAFASDHRTDRQYSVYSHSGEEQVDELAEGTASPVQSLKSPPRSKGRSRSRAAKQRKAVAAASESLPASSAREDSTAETDLSRNSSTSSGGPPVTNVSGIDREILKKLIEALAARRQVPSLPVSPCSEKEQENKGKCQHARGLGKDRHHPEKKEREQDNSEDFFEEIVEEIVEPQNGAKGTGDKDAPCGCCQGQSVAIDDLDQRQLSLEEVLRHEDSIRFDAQLEDRRRLLDEERIREEERLAFREYLSQRDEVLDDGAGRLPDTPLQELKEALQRELAKRRDARAKLEAARSQAAGSTAPQVAAPSSGQAPLGTEVKAKEPSMPGTLKSDPGKQAFCANRRTSRPSLQLGTTRRASFAPELETIAGTAPSSPANMDATKAPASI